MSNVDPFVITWPKPWIENEEIRPVIIYLNRFLHDLWLRTGGGTDAISDGVIREFYPWPIRKDEARDFFSVSSDHYCYASEIIEATSNVTVYLSGEPYDAELVTVKRNTTAGNVVVDGNGSNIDGSSTFNMNLNFDSKDFIYSASSGAWLII